MPPDMPAAKLRPVGAEDDGPAAGHVLAAVVADALGDDRGAGVAHAEPLADAAAQEQLAAGGAVGDDVAGDGGVLREVVGRAVGADDDPAAGQALADVVVGVALEPQGDAPGQEGAEGLAGRAGEGDVDGAVGQARAAVLLGHLVAEHGADGAVDVADRHLRADRGAVVQRARRRAGSARCPAPCPGRGPGRWCGAARRPRAARARTAAAPGPGPAPSSGRSRGRRRAARRGRWPPRACGSPARPAARGPPRR